MLGLFLLLVNLQFQDINLDNFIYLLHAQNLYEKSRNACLKQEICRNHTLFKKNILKPNRNNTVECLDKALSPAPFRNSHTCKFADIEISDDELFIRGNLACKQCHFLSSKAKIFVFGDIEAEEVRVDNELIVLAVGKIQINKLLGRKIFLFSTSKEVIVENCANTTVFSNASMVSFGRCQGSLKFIEGVSKKFGIISSNFAF